MIRFANFCGGAVEVLMLLCLASKKMLEALFKEGLMKTLNEFLRHKRYDQMFWSWLMAIISLFQIDQSEHFEFLMSLCGEENEFFIMIDSNVKGNIENIELMCRLVEGLAQVFNKESEKARLLSPIY